MGQAIENRLRETQLHLIDIAPSPVFTPFEGLHNRVLSVVKVFGRVFVFGRITAADMPAFQT